MGAGELSSSPGPSRDGDTCWASRGGAQEAAPRVRCVGSRKDVITVGTPSSGSGEALPFYRR